MLEYRQTRVHFIRRSKPFVIHSWAQEADDLIESLTNSRGRHRFHGVRPCLGYYIALNTRHIRDLAVRWQEKRSTPPAYLLPPTDPEDPLAFAGEDAEEKYVEEMDATDQEDEQARPDDEALVLRVWLQDEEAPVLHKYLPYAEMVELFGDLTRYDEDISEDDHLGPPHFICFTDADGDDVLYATARIELLELFDLRHLTYDKLKEAAGSDLGFRAEDYRAFQ